MDLWLVSLVFFSDPKIVQHSTWSKSIFRFCGVPEGAAVLKGVPKTKKSGL